MQCGVIEANRENVSELVAFFQRVKILGMDAEPFLYRGPGHKVLELFSVDELPPDLRIRLKLAGWLASKSAIELNVQVPRRLEYWSWRKVS